MTKIKQPTPAIPPHGGSWRQDPDTGELVLVTENVPAPVTAADKEKK